MEPDPVSGAGVMLDYLHLEAMANGTISGAWREWPKVRAEAKAALAELRRLRNIEAELAELRAWATHDPATCRVCQGRGAR